MKKILATLIIALSVINVANCQNWEKDEIKVSYHEGEGWDLKEFATNDIMIIFGSMNPKTFSGENAYLKVRYYDNMGEVKKGHGIALDEISDGSLASVTDVKLCDTIRKWLNTDGNYIEFYNDKFHLRIKGKMPFVGKEQKK